MLLIRHQLANDILNSWYLHWGRE